MQSRFLEIMEDEIMSNPIEDEEEEPAPADLSPTTIINPGPKHFFKTKKLGSCLGRYLQITKRNRKYGTPERGISEGGTTHKERNSPISMKSEKKSQNELLDPNMLLSARDMREKRYRRAANIARVLLHVLMDEMEIHSLLVDYVGYPYRTRSRTSAWDRPSEQGEGQFIMGQHQELFPDAVALLWRDLLQRGFIVHNLTFQEESITFPTSAAGECKTRKGIGLGWRLQ